MDHFPSGFDALILGSYWDLYGRYGHEPEKCYSLLACEDGDELAWYYEHQLTPIAGPHGEEAIREIRLKAERA